jgi:uncharacterized membrane protein SirB2
MELYPTLKLVHVSCVTLTAAGFLLRGSWMLREDPRLRHRLTRTLPHVVDTGLLASGLGMVLMLQQYPFVSPWLTAKLLALLAYVALGSVALKRGRTPAVRAGAFAGAILVLAYLVGVAVAHDPWPFPILVRMA